MLPMIGLAAVSTGLNYFAQSSAANSAARQQSAISNAENDAIAKHNMSQILRNSYKVGMLNMQLGIQKQQAQQEGFNTTAQALALRGASEANIAATGTVGSSADAVLADIDMKLGEAQAVQGVNNEMLFINYENDLEAMRMNALQNVVDAKEYRYSGPSSGQMLAGAAASAAMTLGSQYVARRMSLGLGDAPTSTKPTTQNSVSALFGPERPLIFGPGYRLGGGY